ncbi:MAG TPA: ATP-dependent DNA helicase [Actinotalea sp.]|jgi:DNA helicase-2/ATP-dependent DNA helicase PcrA
MTTHLSAAEIAAHLGQHAPTAEQVAIIEAPLAPVLVVAGAGSGKTETMAARVVYLIANGLVEPDRVLGLTFTRKAAGELSERIRRRLRSLRAARARRGDPHPSALVAPTVSTYNAYAAGLVRDHALRLGLEPSARLLGEAGRWQLAHEVVERWTSDLGVDLAPVTVTTAVLDLAGALSEHLVDPGRLRAETEALVDAIAATPDTGGVSGTERRLIEEVQGSLRLRGRLVDLVEEFTDRKRQGDLVDFGDQVAMAARLAREVPDVGAGERARFGVVLLDEYQDTSVAQLELLRHLFGAGDDRTVDGGPVGQVAAGAGRAGGLGHPVTAVGDPHQSIYGWRGASAGGLERFPEHFRALDGKPAQVLALSTSWRNDHAVLGAANLVAAPLRRASEASLDLPELAARAGAGSGDVIALFAETLEDEARAVAEFIAEQRTVDPGAWPAGAAPVDGRAGVQTAPVRTAAVLCRKRSQFPVLQAALLARGLPVEVVGLGGLLSTPEVVDLVAALEAAHDPSRGDSLMRLLTGPRARLGLADLHALADWSAELAGPRPPVRPDAPTAGGPQPSGGTAQVAPDVIDERSIVDALDDLPRAGWVSRRGRALSSEGRARLAELAATLRALRAQTFLPVVDLVGEAEVLLGLDIEVASRPGVDPSSARANLDAFRTVAASFSDSSDAATLGAFLAWLTAAQQEERGLEAPVTDMDPAAVQLLTVHAAKGLEWDVVAVPGLVERTFPVAPKTSGWIKDRGALPTALRGDRESLPDVRLAGAADLRALVDRLDTYVTEHRAHQESEERRLAYVALTRARSRLMVSGSWWRDGARPTPPSVFLRELVEAADAGVSVASWADDPSAPGPDGQERRPVRPEPEAVEAPSWPPADALGSARQAGVDRAAAAVRDAVRRAAAPADAAGELPPEPDEHDPVMRDLADVAELLLDERRRGSVERSTVPLPAHLSTSALVRLAADPAQFAVQLRRPIPTEPSVHARRGTAFHAWVESYFGSAALVDVDALPGAQDDSAVRDEDLVALQRRFLGSVWAGLTPVAVEVDIETPVGGVIVRSRIDAVFSDPDGPPGSVVVVDWKTGRPPTDPDIRRSREVQLAVYRFAWARSTGLPLDRVDAAFVYLSTGETVRPTALLDVDDIESLLSREVHADLV